MRATREERVERALFRGAGLTLDHSAYCRAVRALTGLLVETDSAPSDLTARALKRGDRRASAAIVAREGGVAAGLTEYAFVLRSNGLAVEFEKRDGDPIEAGDVLMRTEGGESELLALERVGLNLLQRMSGIASTSRCLQQRLRQKSFATRVVGTRKTPWGLLDKRALHLGNGGTHRLGLGDAIVIKNNHLALLAEREEDAAPVAIERAWRLRGESAFVEVEVRSEEAARAAAATFRRLRDEEGEEYPCLLMLDNMKPARIAAILEMLRGEGLWDDTLVEASGGILETGMETYAATGVDALSIGALTHSARALDICQRIS